MPIVKIPAPLKFYVNNQSEFHAKGATVAELLEDVVAHYPAFKPHLFDGSGRLRRYFNVFVNGVHIRDLNGLETPLQESDRIILMASAAGGA
jgi:molybdopterin converting factor small subunit